MVRRGNFLYVADAYNNALRAINLTTRAVTTVIGDVATQAEGTTDGPIASARLDMPHSLALDAANSQLFIGELRGARVRVLNLTTNVVSTLVTGTGAITSLAYDASGKRLLASIFDDNKVLSVDVAQKTFGLFAGSGNYGEVDGPPTTAAFRSPHGVAVSGTTAFVADYHGPTIRKLVANGSGAFQATTLAGLATDAGHKDAIGAEARFESPGDMALAPDNHTMYVVDGDSNCAIRTFDTNTAQVGTLAGGADCTSVDGTGVAATFQRPGSMTMAIPTPGRPPVLLVTEERGVVRKVDTANARVTTLNTGDDTLPTWRGIAATASAIYVCGEGERKIFRLPVAGGALAAYAGTGEQGCDDGAVAAATLGRPAGVIWDGATTLFFADQDCMTIRRIDLMANTVQTVAGGDQDGNGAEDPDGTGKKAAFAYPAGLMWDRQKKGFYVQDVHVVRWVDATTFEVKTIVGDKDSHGGVWLPPNPPRLNFPGGTVEGLDGELYLTSERAILKWVAP
jgi:DNA-binding beta-propeller fold protein YncE